jgi:flavodoxin
MNKAIIIYHSKTGITKRYAEEITAYLQNREIEAKLIPIESFESGLVKNVDTVFLGCWTSGLMIMLQHPDKIWAEFANRLPDLKEKTVILFTTYKLATGNMFRKMEKLLTGKLSDIKAELKSKKGKLSEIDKIVLDDLIK